MPSQWNTIPLRKYKNLCKHQTFVLTHYAWRCWRTLLAIDETKVFAWSLVRSVTTICQANVHMLMTVAISHFQDKLFIIDPYIHYINSGGVNPVRIYIMGNGGYSVWRVTCSATYPFTVGKRSYILFREIFVLIANSNLLTLVDLK